MLVTALVAGTASAGSGLLRSDALTPHASRVSTDYEQPVRVASTRFPLVAPPATAERSTSVRAHAGNQGLSVPNARALAAEAEAAGGAERTVVMGRNMGGRVIPYPEKNGYDYYSGTPSWIPRSLERVAPNTMRKVDLWFNKRWINNEIAAGSRIIDIGEPPGMPPSDFYNMEQGQVDGYWNYFQDPQP